MTGPQPPLTAQSPGHCQVELYGPARLAAGVKQVSIPVGEGLSLAQLVRALAARCPALVGSVVDPERGALLDGYIFNRNGRDFLARPDALVRPGDRVLLLASTAGG
ncbi:MAG TPA: MoaD/ThiS family protein [Chloroflexota bacterium]|nr:MoaD/ThiS family protein [Chloroflexota bacterium]HZU05074.1 MoaD/ThiS family protein [Chloroflexota bacterium]